MPVHLPYSSSNFLRVPPATSCVPQRFPIGFPPSTIAVNSLSLLHTFNLGSPLCVPYAIHERSKNCLFPRRLIFYLVTEVPKYLKASSSKSSKYLSKGQAWRFTRLRCSRGEHREISVEAMDGHKLSPLPPHLQANWRAFYPCACVERSEQEKE